MAGADEPLLQLHLEPQEPIEVAELTASLGALARQYQEFAVANGLTGKAADARLLVSNVSAGSIDISLLPDWISGAVAGPLLMPLLDKYGLLQKFAERIKALIDFFASWKRGAAVDVTIKDCDDAINLVKPIAMHGGNQTINVIKGDVVINVLSTSVREARQAIEGAVSVKEGIQSSQPRPEKHQRVSMTWDQLDRNKAKTEGKQSPDKGIIEEIDTKPHPIFFTDELSFLKQEMIADEENQFRKVYFVDVEISRAAGGRVAAYRIIGYHGKEEI